MYIRVPLLSTKGGITPNDGTDEFEEGSAVNKRISVGVIGAAAAALLLPADVEDDIITFAACCVIDRDLAIRVGVSGRILFSNRLFVNSSSNSRFGSIGTKLSGLSVALRELAGLVSIAVVGVGICGTVAAIGTVVSIVCRKTGFDTLWV